MTGTTADENAKLPPGYALAEDWGAVDTGTMADETGMLPDGNDEFVEEFCFGWDEIAENTSSPKDESGAKPFPETVNDLESLAGGPDGTMPEAVYGLGGAETAGPDVAIPNPSCVAEGVIPLFTT